jgi:hypothetical protein
VNPVQQLFDPASTKMIAAWLLPKKTLTGSCECWSLVTLVAALNVCQCEAQVGIACGFEARKIGNIHLDLVAQVSESCQRSFVCLKQFPVTLSKNSISQGIDVRSKSALASFLGGRCGVLSVVAITLNGEGVGIAGNNKPADEGEKANSKETVECNRHVLIVFTVWMLVSAFFAGSGARYWWDVWSMPPNI